MASPIIYKAQRRLALRHWGGAKSEGPEPSRLEISDPMIEADALSTEVVAKLSVVCPAHRG